MKWCKCDDSKHFTEEFEVYFLMWPLQTDRNGDIICSDLMCELTVNFFKKKMKLFLEFFSAADRNSGSKHKRSKTKSIYSLTDNHDCMGYTVVNKSRFYEI